MPYLGLTPTWSNRRSPLHLQPVTAFRSPTKHMIRLCVAQLSFPGLQDYRRRQVRYLYARYSCTSWSGEGGSPSATTPQRRSLLRVSLGRRFYRHAMSSEAVCCRGATASFGEQGAVAQNHSRSCLILLHSTTTPTRDRQDAICRFAGPEHSPLTSSRHFAQPLSHGIGWLLLG